jgi:hypothetical protein
MARAGIEGDQVKTIEPFEVPGTSVEPLFAAWFAGHVPALPDAIVAAGVAYLGLASEQPKLRSERDALRHTRHASIAEAHTLALAEETVANGRKAADRALQMIEAAVTTGADELVVEYLRPAHDDALAAVRAVLPELRDVDLADMESVARAGVDTAFLVVARATERLAALDRAREAVFVIAERYGAWRDQWRGSREAGALRDTKHWPDRIVSAEQRAAKQTTGPVHPWVRTAWLADPANGAWLPTWREWDAEWTAWYLSDERNGRVTPRVATVRG